MARRPKLPGIHKPDARAIDPAAYEVTINGRLFRLPSLPPADLVAELLEAHSTLWSSFDDFEVAAALVRSREAIRELFRLLNPTVPDRMLLGLQEISILHALVTGGPDAARRKQAEIVAATAGMP